jgi:hypothetical protein
MRASGMPRGNGSSGSMRMTASMRRPTNVCGG